MQSYLWKITKYVAKHGRSLFHFILVITAERYVNITYKPKKLPTNQHTGCPNKHGNSVTNSISSFQIILWFSIVIPTEKTVIRKIFVCFVYNLLVYVLTAYAVVLSKTRKLQFTNTVNLSVFTVNISKTLYRHLYSLFHKINSSRHNNIISFEIRYYNANS